MLKNTGEVDMEPTVANVKGAIERSLNAVLPASDKNLFDLGLLDSLQSVILLVNLEKAFGVKLSALDFAENASFTVKNIALVIAKTRNTPLH